MFNLICGTFVFVLHYAHSPIRFCLILMCPEPWVMSVRDHTHRICVYKRLQESFFPFSSTWLFVFYFDHAVFSGKMYKCNYLSSNIYGRCQCIYCYMKWFCYLCLDGTSCFSYVLYAIQCIWNLMRIIACCGLFNS